MCANGQKPSSFTATPAVIPASYHKAKGNLFFDASQLCPNDEYVGWIDVMGSESIMLRSLRIASNFVMKLHIAALRASKVFTSVELYPVIDGIYICSSQQKAILTFIDHVYSTIADVFNDETDNYQRFLIRGGLAFGPVMKGSGSLDCSEELKSNDTYTKQILLGPPLTQAYRIEDQSSPFGLIVHESVRSFAPKGEKVLSITHHKWWKYNTRTGDNLRAEKVYHNLESYFDWCSKHSFELGYKKESMNRHREIAREYFDEFVK